MYIYQADVYCDACGRALRKAIPRPASADPDDESTYDSDEWPKGPHLPDATDSPNHCAGGESCLGDRIDLRDYGLQCTDELFGAETRYLGELVSDSLTDDGALWLSETITTRQHPCPRRTAYQRALHRFWGETFADYLELEEED